MGKYKISVELTGLKIEVEGDQELAPRIAKNLTAQISHAMQPPTIIGSLSSGDGATGDGNSHSDGHGAQPRKKRRGGNRTVGSSASSDAASLTWSHDATTWGTPRQEWKSAQKIAWLLHVICQATGQPAELTPTQIANAFNNKFKSAGLIRRQNIGRDLGNDQDQFGEVDGRWFLKEKGKQEAEKLVAAATGQTAVEAD